MMKKALVLLALLFLIVSVYAYDLNACEGDADFNAIGNCIIRGTFGADPKFFAIIMLLIFTIFMWQSRVPSGAAIGIGLIIFFALGTSLGDLYQPLLNLAVLAIGVMVGLAILHFVRR